MGDFLLIVVTVASVGAGGYWLGRASMRDRVAFLLEELDAAVECQIEMLKQDKRHPSLRLVKGD
jgi:hypothetical protein